MSLKLKDSHNLGVSHTSWTSPHTHQASKQQPKPCFSPHRLSDKHAISHQRTSKAIDHAHRRVRFAAQNQTLLFVSTRPPSLTCSPMYRFHVTPKNCADLLAKAEWLSSIPLMRTSPYSRLDYLTVGRADFKPPGDVFSLEDEEPGNEYFLVGEVAVFNLDYAKEVLIHYTFDNWQSTRVSQSRYAKSIGALRLDKFRFTIAAPETNEEAAESSRTITLQLVIEYRVMGKSYWDNFDNQNYQFECCFDPSPLFEEATFEPLVPEAAPRLNHVSDPPPTLPISIPIPSPRRRTAATFYALGASSPRRPEGGVITTAHTAPITSTIHWVREQSLSRKASSWGSDRCLVIPRTMSLAF